MYDIDTIFTACKIGGGPFLWTFGFHLFQWERRCQLGCHFEDGPPSFASFLRSVSLGHSLPVHLHLHARQTDVEITVSTTAHAWTHRGRGYGVVHLQVPLH